MDPSKMLKVPPDDLIPAPTPRASLDQNTISRTTSKRQSGAPSRMITIPGNSDHHRLESVITIIWND
jgi:hypothetical protein